MIQIFKNTQNAQKLRKMKDFTPASWVYVTEPSESESKRLADKLNIPIDIIEDSIDEYELPRVQFSGDNVIVILRAAIKTQDSYTTTPLTIILNSQFITTISTRRLDILDDIKKQRVSFLTSQQSNFFIRICLLVIDDYQQFITKINRSVQSKRSNIRNISRTDIAKLVENEEILNNFVGSLSASINSIKKILHNNYIPLYRSDKELINDLLVDAEQVYELSLNNMKTIRNLRDGYTTLLTINLNQIIKVLTYITVFFTIPMIIASIYGMNIKLPFAESDHAFLILGVITLTFFGLALLFFTLFKKGSKR